MIPPIWNRIRRCIITAAGILACIAHAHAAVVHPMDPLEDSRSSARRSSCWAPARRSRAPSSRASTCASPPKDVVLAFQPGNPIARAATVYFRQNKKSYKTVVNLDRRHVHAARADSEERRPARSHDHRGLGLLVRVPEPGVPAGARAARHHDARTTRERVRHTADARLVRPPRGIAPDREGADVLPRRCGDQPVRQTDRRPAGDHGPRRSRRAAGDRYRRRCRCRRSRTSSTRPRWQRCATACVRR